jgi:hypothetical protein
MLQNFFKKALVLSIFFKVHPTRQKRDTLSSCSVSLSTKKYDMHPRFDRILP